jgi:hypothetical protein
MEEGFIESECKQQALVLGKKDCRRKEMSEFSTPMKMQ